MDTLTKALEPYLDLCASMFRRLTDGQPWTEIAVNPAPTFREVISRLEKSPQFKDVAVAFEKHAESTDLVFEGPDRIKQFWHVRSFLWNLGVYDSLIRGKAVAALQLADAMLQEAKRGDAHFRQAAFLDSFASPSVIDVGEFSIRHLADDEIDALFAGRCQLDQNELPRVVHEKLAEAWFIVVDEPARPLADYISFGGPIGSHDWHGAFRNINLGLNLFKSTAGPVVLTETYSWNTSTFHLQQRPCPEHRSDFYPSSWGGSEEPPLMRMYQLNEGEVAHLPVFWRAFDDTYLKHQRFLPDYLHRAVGRFLEACGWKRYDFEFRQAHYVMALEALFSGEPDGEPSNDVRPVDRFGNKIGPVLCVARCCGNLVAPKKHDIVPLVEWLGGDKRKGTKGIYQQRSRILHGSTFEQKEFYAQPQDPDDHHESQRLCKILQIPTDPIWDGPDVGFSVLHNVVRLSLLAFVGHVAACLATGDFKAVAEQIEAATGGDELIQARRKDLRMKLHAMFMEEKRKLLQGLYDSFGNEAERQKIVTSVGNLRSHTR